MRKLPSRLRAERSLAFATTRTLDSLATSIQNSFGSSGVSRMPHNKTPQLTWHSAFESESGSLLASTLGA